MALGALGGLIAWQRSQGDAAEAGRFVRSGGGEMGTAVITGASSGIGETFARQLAKAGYDLILVARREDRLARLASELSINHGIMAEVVAADLATDVGIERIEETIGKLNNLTLLVNNAGFGLYGPMVELGLFKQVDMIHLHVNATMRLTRAAVTKMLPSGRGGVINTSSIVAFFSGENSANYCGTKTYVRIFSEAVHKEVSSQGVHVQCLCPGYVYTEFHDTEAYDHFERSSVPEWLWMSADEVVAESLTSLGNGKPTIIPGWVNKGIVALGFFNIELNDLRKLGSWLKEKSPV